MSYDTTPKASEVLHTAQGLAKNRVLVAHMLLALLQVRGVGGGLINEVAAAQGVTPERLEVGLAQGVRELIEREEGAGT